MPFALNRNLVDAANIAALAALSTFRRPECMLGGGEDGQDVIVHPPEVCLIASITETYFEIKLGLLSLPTLCNTILGLHHKN